MSMVNDGYKTIYNKQIDISDIYEKQEYYFTTPRRILDTGSDVISRVRRFLLEVAIDSDAINRVATSVQA